MRAVLDTNILARPAYRAQGPAAEVLKRISQPPHTLVVSAAILSELDRILRYPRFRRVHGLSDEEIDTYIMRVALLGTFVASTTRVSVPSVPGDPDDERIIATAIEGRATAICTLDRHFQHTDVQSFCAAHGIRVLTDVQLLAELRQAESASSGEQP